MDQKVTVRDGETVILGGLAPIMWSDGTGAEVMQRHPALMARQAVLVKIDRLPDPEAHLAAVDRNRQGRLRERRAQAHEERWHARRQDHASQQPRDHPRGSPGRRRGGPAATA